MSDFEKELELESNTKCFIRLTNPDIFGFKAIFATLYCQKSIKKFLPKLCFNKSELAFYDLAKEYEIEQKKK